MKKRKLRRLVGEVLDARASIVPRTTVTFRTMGVDFDSREIILDGRHIKVEQRGFDIPIRSGDAVCIPRGNVERIQ